MSLSRHSSTVSSLRQWLQWRTDRQSSLSCRHHDLFRPKLLYRPMRTRCTTCSYSDWQQPITCSAAALSRVLRTALVPYGNMEISTPHSTETSQLITMKLCTFDNVCETNKYAKFGWNPPATVCSTHTWNIHFLWLFFHSAFLASCLPACFFSCAPAQVKRIEIISRTMAQKTQFGVGKCSPSK